MPPFRNCRALSFMLLLALFSASRRAWALPAGAQIDQAIQRLGDDDPAVREAASRFLWSAGRAAEPALTVAAASSDPEVAARAAAILDDFKFGLTPDAPREIRELLRSCRSADSSTRRAAALEILRKYPRSLAVVLRVAAREQDPAVRQAVFDQLPPAAAGVCLAVGEPRLAEQLLLHRLQSPQTYDVHQYVAYLMFTGGLDKKIAELTPRNNDTASGMLLTLCHRAKGDLASAARAAEASGDESLRMSIAWERRDYKSLAAYYARAAASSDTQQDLNLAAAFAKATGDEAALIPMRAKLVERAANPAPEGFDAVKALFMIDRPDDGIKALQRRGQGLMAAELLDAQLRYDEALALDSSAPTTDAARFTGKIQAANTYAELGEKERGLALAAEAESLCGTSPPDVWAVARVVDAYTRLGNRAAGEAFAFKAIAGVKPDTNTSSIWYAIFPGKGETADAWLQLLRAPDPAELPDTIARVKAIMTGKADANDLRRWSAAAEAALSAESKDASGRAGQFIAVAEGLLTAGLEAEARECLGRAATACGDADPLVRLGDLDASEMKWSAAAADYGLAVTIDPGRPLPLYLQGRALSMSGDVKAGEKLKSLAHATPLANDTLRYTLIEGLENRGLYDDAKAEEAVFPLVSEFDSWYLHNARDRAAQAAAASGDFKTAAAAAEQAFLSIYTSGVMFSNDVSLLQTPATIHRYKALAALDAEDMTATLAEVRLAMAAMPADTDLAIAVYPALRKRGQNAEADALLRASIDLYRALLGRHPNSSMLHNNLAWIEAKCDGDAADALAHAQRAVELDPSPGLLDTLAEAYRRHGDRAEAIAAAERALKLDPASAYLQGQLRRFQAAASATAPLPKN